MVLAIPLSTYTVMSNRGTKRKRGEKSKNSGNILEKAKNELELKRRMYQDEVSGLNEEPDVSEESGNRIKEDKYISNEI